MVKRRLASRVRIIVGQSHPAAAVSIHLLPAPETASLPQIIPFSCALTSPGWPCDKHEPPAMNKFHILLILAAAIAPRCLAAAPATSAPPPAPLAPATLPGEGLARHDFLYAGEAGTQN